jgi:hypothetical protein
MIVTITMTLRTLPKKIGSLGSAIVAVTVAVTFAFAVLFLLHRHFGHRVKYICCHIIQRAQDITATVTICACGCHFSSETLHVNKSFYSGIPHTQYF